MQFTYKVADGNGRLEVGREEAASSEQVIAMLKARGKYPLEVKAESQLKTSMRHRRFSIKERLSFTQQLAGLLNAGVSLEKALAILNRLTFSSELGVIIGHLHRLIQEGHSFTAALEKYPQQFPALYVNLVRAGEAGGLLPQVLRRLVGYEEEQLSLRNFIISSLVYPVILAVASTGVLMIYVAVVIPKFQTIFEEMNSQLPLITQLVMLFGVAFQRFGWLIPVIVGGGIAVLLKTLATADGRLRFDRWKLRVPFLGVLLQKIAIARMSMSLSMLCISGVPLLSGLAMAGEVAGNLAVVEALKEVVKEVKQGSTLVNSLTQKKLFPVLAIEMIGIGEESGNLGEMLEQVAKTYEADVKQNLSLFLSVFEPVLILAMVGVIAVLAAAILLPIVNLNSQMDM